MKTWLKSHNPLPLLALLVCACTPQQPLPVLTEIIKDPPMTADGKSMDKEATSTPLTSSFSPAHRHHRQFKQRFLDAIVPIVRYANQEITEEKLIWAKIRTANTAMAITSLPKFRVRG